MKKSDLKKLNEAIASLHDENDVYSYEINESKRIEFPRGFLRTLATYRLIFPFIENKILLDKIAHQMMLRDTFHWLWLKTDIRSYPRHMLIKSQLINLASILEAIIKYLYPEQAQKKVPIYAILDLLSQEKNIEVESLKMMWKERNKIHLLITNEVETFTFSDKKYIEWHRSMATFIKQLSHGV